MMKKTSLILTIATCVLSLLMVSAAWAACTEGKQPVNITTPSGKAKTLCIPDAAVQGIENAAEHAGGTIVTANCTCWSQKEIQELIAKYDLSCVYFESKDNIMCYKDSTYSTLWYDLYPYDDKVSDICYNHLYGSNKIISFEESDACYALLEPYIKKIEP
jgi:hypothetical protein